MSGTIVMAAPNGARRTKADHPNLPMSPAELAAEAVLCRDAGASVLHLHVRDGEGAHSLDVGLYREALAEARGAVGESLVLQVTTEAVGRYSPEEQIAVVRALKPEAVSLALRELVPAPEREPAARELFGWMRDNRVWAQVILYDPADIARFVALADTGMFAVARPSVLLVLGRYTVGQVSDPEDLTPMLEALAPVRDAVCWSVCAFGAKENACMARAIAEGGHARVGFENNFFLPDGRRAGHTADLVALAAETARNAGRPPLSADAVRAMIAGWF